MYTADQKLIIIIIQIKKGFSCRNFCALSEPFVRSVGFFLRFPLCKVCFFVWGTGTMPLPHLRESRHCCILNFTTWIPDSMYCTSFLLVELAFWIPIISGILCLCFFVSPVQIKYRIFCIFRILQYSMYSALPPNRVTQRSGRTS